MSYKILEQNGVENEVVDGGALNNFCAGNRDGIIAGVLSECALSAAGNGVAISPGLLIICGVRIKITASETLYVSSVPLRATRYQIIAQVTLGADGNTSAEFFLQSNAFLKRDAIYAQGYGTYQAEIGSFTHNPDGSISDMVRTLDVLYGGGNGSANIEVGNVVTQTLPAGQDAEFDMTARNENGKTIFDVKALIPRGASGTDEEAVHFTPQTLTEAQKTQARKNIGALDEAEADIQHIAVDCDHENEITGYTGHEWNVAVPDQCQLTVTKIKGQTGRKSLNLIKGTSKGDVSGLSTALWCPLNLVQGKTYTIQIYCSVSCSCDFRDVNGEYLSYIGGAVGLNTLTFTKGEESILNIYLAAAGSWWAMLVEGTYTADSMPAYQPFDDTLVNSKVKRVLSTGKNLYSGKNDLDWTPGYLENKYPHLDKGTYSIYVYAENPSGVNQYQLQGLDEYGNEVYSTPAVFVNTGFLMEVTVPISKILLYVNTTGHIKVMLNYGSSTLPYQPYISDDTFNVDIEITGFGEIDNISKTFNEYGSDSVITLNGSEAWQYETTTAGNGRFYVYRPSQIVGGASGATQNNTASNWIDVTANQTYDGVVGLAYDGENLLICNPAYSTLEDFKAWLAANPIQFIYRLATPRIQTTVDIPAGYSAHKGGLQQQVIEGDYLPYIITKDYPVSGAAQILKNLEIDRDQGKMLDAIQQGALPVGKLANAITIISGDTKKTFDGSTPVEITASGEAGPPGERGEQGVPGEAATITIRNVDVGTALPGQPATVVIKNVGTSTNAILDFGFMIPRGEQGEQGEQGIQGVPGKSSLMLVVIMNPVIGGSSYYGRILLTCPVPSTGRPNNGFENLIPALKYHDYPVSGIISLDQSTLNAKRVYGLRKMAHNGNKLYALIDSQTISAVEAGEELTGASAVVFSQL